MTRFLVAVDDTTAPQRDAISQFLKQNFGYWHWMADIWLLVTHQSKFTPVTLREEIKKLAPEASILVAPITSVGPWAIYAPKESLAWFDKNWQND